MSQNPQMDVLYMRGLGHVLGIFTRNGRPVTEETDASSFVGDGLHLRGSPPFLPPPPYVTNQDLLIPPGLIGLFSASRNWRQIFQPFTLYATGLPSAPALKTFTSTPPALAYSVATLTLTITLTTGIDGNILILALDTTGGTPVSFNLTVTAAQTSVPVAMTGLISGHKYNAFAFVPTYPMAVLNPPFTA